MKWNTPPQWLYLLILSAIISSLFAIEIWSWDLWWHLATGRWIVEHWAIPTVDPFSFTAAGEPWINVNWLAAILFYGFFWFGGPAGVVALKVLIAFGLLFFLGLSLRELGVRWPLVAASLVCFAVMVQPRVSMARPSSIGAMLCTVAVYLIIRTAQRRDKSCFALIPLIFVWMNIHGSAVLGVVLTGMLVVTSLFIRKMRAVRISSVITLVAVSLLFLATDRGNQILVHAFSLHQGSYTVKATAEWKPLSIHYRIVWVPWTLFGFSSVYCAIRVRKYPLLLGLSLLSAVLGTSYVRHLFIAILLVAPAVTLAFQELALLLDHKGLHLAKRFVPVAMLLSVLGLHLAAEREIAVNLNFGFSTMVERYPHDTLLYLRKLPFGRTMNDYQLGGYLIWEKIPGGVYLDGRTIQVFRDQQMKDLWFQLFDGKGGLERVADQYQIVYGIAGYKAALIEPMMESNRWIPIFFADSSVLLVRATSASNLTAAGFPIFPQLRYFPTTKLMRKYYDSVLSTTGGVRAFTDQFVQAAAQNEDSQFLVSIFRFMQLAYPKVAADISTRISSGAPHSKQLLRAPQQDPNRGSAIASSTDTPRSAYP